MFVLKINKEGSRKVSNKETRLKKIIIETKVRVMGCTASKQTAESVHIAKKKEEGAATKGSKDNGIQKPVANASEKKPEAGDGHGAPAEDDIHAVPDADLLQF